MTDTKAASAGSGFFTIHKAFDIVVHMSKKQKNSQNITKSSWRSFLEKFLSFGSVFITAVLPLLYFPGRIAPEITSKSFFFIGAVDIMLCVWAVLMVLDVRYRLTRRMGLFLLPALLFLASLTVSSIFGVDPATSFFSNIESGIGLVFLYHCLAFAFILASIVRVQGIPFIRGILKATLFASVVATILIFIKLAAVPTTGFLTKTGGGVTLGNVLFAGAYFVFSLFLGVILIGLEESKTMKVVYGVCLILIAFSPIFFLDSGIWKGLIGIQNIFVSPQLILGEARMAAGSIGLGVIFAFFLWLVLASKKSLTRWIGAAGVFLIVISLIVVVWQGMTPKSFINNFFIQESEVRPLYWHEAVEGIKERPILGWGHENFYMVHQKFLEPSIFDPKYANEIWTVHPHNASLETLVNGGIVGFSLYAALVIVIGILLVQLYRKRIINDATCAILTGMFFAYLLQNQMLFETLVAQMVFFALIGVLSGLNDPISETIPINFSFSIQWQKIVAGIFIVSMIPVWIYFAWLPARKSIEVVNVGLLGDRATIEDYRHLFHSGASYVITTDLGMFTASLLTAYDSQKLVVMNDEVHREAFIAGIDRLVGGADSVWVNHSSMVRLNLSLAQLVNLKIFLKIKVTPEDFALVKKYLEQGIKLSPTNAILYTTYADAYIYSGDVIHARALARKAIDLYPGYPYVWQYLVNLENYLGTPETKKATIIEAQKYFPGETFE